MLIPSAEPLASLVASEFDLPADVVYLNAASVGVYPRRVTHAVNAFHGRRDRPWELGTDIQFGILRATRERCATLIGAASNEISLAPNTSMGVHTAAFTLPIPPDKVVLGHAGDFPANVYPWMAALARVGGRYESFPLTDGLVDEDALIARLDRGDVAVLTVSWVSFTTGQRLDLRRLGEACRARGVYFVVDAMQGLGAMRLDVSHCPIDVLACGGHKWLLGPFGSGFFYVRRALAETLTPATGGWLGMRDGESFAHLLRPDIVYEDDGRKFELATLGFQDYTGLEASVSLMLEMGLDAVESYVDTLATRLLEGIAAMPALALVTPHDQRQRAGIVSCVVRGAGVSADGGVLAGIGGERSEAGVRRLDALIARLDRAGIRYSVRAGGILRFSPHLYNSLREIDRTLEALAG